MKIKQLLLMAGTAAFLFVGCTNNGESANTQSNNTGSDLGDATPLGQASVQDDVSAKNILQIGIGSPDHTTLVAAVQATKIEHVLVNAGPITLFAPTNDAFAALPEGTVETLLKEENLPDLKRILYYHASPGTYMGDKFKDGMNIYQANGKNVKVTKEGDDVFINGAKILGTVDASNGVVHVIDKVLLPPED